MALDDSLLRQVRHLRDVIESDDADGLEKELASGSPLADFAAHYGQSPIAAAASSGSVEILRLLIPKFDLTSFVGEEALVEAIEEDQCEAAELLLEAGVSAGGSEYQEESDWNSPISAAFQHCNPRMLKLLCKFGAVEKSEPGWLDESIKMGLGARRRSSDTCLRILAPRLVERLQADPEFRLNPGSLARLARVLEGNGSAEEDQLASFLKGRVDDRKALEEELFQIFLDSSEHGDLTQVRRFLERLPASSRVEIIDSFLPYLARGAYEEDHWDLVVELIKAGADVNASDDRGGTLLMFAARDGQVNLVRLLLDRGCAVNAVEEHGNTALDYVYLSGLSDPSIENLLRESGALTSAEMARPALRRELSSIVMIFQRKEDGDFLVQPFFKEDENSIENFGGEQSLVAFLDMYRSGLGLVLDLFDRIENERWDSSVSCTPLSATEEASFYSKHRVVEIRRSGPLMHFVPLLARGFHLEEVKTGRRIVVKPSDSQQTFNLALEEALASV